MTNLKFLFVSLILFATPALCQPATEFEKVLLPISISGEVAGGFGSRWVSSLSVFNVGSEPAALRGVFNGCVVAGCTDESFVAGHATTYPTPFPIPQGAQATFLYLESDHLDEVSVHLRVQDISRQALTWGTEIPVVREADALTTATQLLDIPIDERFRNTLRIYDFDASKERIVFVRIYRVGGKKTLPSDAVVAELIVEVPIQLRSTNLFEDLVPGYAQIDLSVFPELATAELVQIEVAPAEAMRFWTFVSVTNNETQHITVVTPQ